MTAAAGTSVSRRRLIASIVAAMGVGLAAVLVRKSSLLFGPHYAPTPFDDLLSRLPDRENAKVLGAAVLAQNKAFDTARTAAQLRTNLASRPFGDVLSAELARGAMVEVGGWVLPESLTTLCALAAKVS